MNLTGPGKIRTYNVDEIDSSSVVISCAYFESIILFKNVSNVYK
jgi:hypothetical protein